MENQQNQPENQNPNEGNLSNANGGPSYGTSSQNEENDPSKEENDYLEGQNGSQQNTPSNTFGQTVNYPKGKGDQEDEIANQGDGTSEEIQFEEDFDDEPSGNVAQRNDGEDKAEHGL